MDHNHNNRYINKKINTSKNVKFIKRYKKFTSNKRKYNNKYQLIHNKINIGGGYRTFIDDFKKRFSNPNEFTKTNLFTPVLNPTNRLIIIGDIHGDLLALVKCLKLAKCIQEDLILPSEHPNFTKDTQFFTEYLNKLRWIGGNTHIVQLGDLIDRVRPQYDNGIHHYNNELDATISEAIEDEASTLKIFALITKLDDLAKQVGGRFIPIIGNHELMNVEQNFGYVSLKEFAGFKNAFDTSEINNMISRKRSKFSHRNITHKISIYRQQHKQFNNNTTNNTTNNITNITKKTNIKNLIGYEERAAAFAPGSICANWLAIQCSPMIQIGSWLMVHGGIITGLFNNSINIYTINTIIRSHLLGNTNAENEQKYNELSNSGNNSIFWTRKISDYDDLPDNLGEYVDKVLDEYNSSITNNKQFVKYVSVGHTPQFFNGKGVNNDNDPRVWCCDIGMSRAFGKNNGKDTRTPAILEVLNDNITKVIM